jgi:hypothetical protein
MPNCDDLDLIFLVFQVAIHFKALADIEIDDFKFIWLNRQLVCEVRSQIRRRLSDQESCLLVAAAQLNQVLIVSHDPNDRWNPKRALIELHHVTLVEGQGRKRSLRPFQVA